jgi:hypothetical protein
MRNLYDYSYYSITFQVVKGFNLPLQYFDNDSKEKEKYARMRTAWFMEQVRGIEPPTTPWQGVVLPLNYTYIFSGHY